MIAAIRIQFPLMARVFAIATTLLFAVATPSRAELINVTLTIGQDIDSIGELGDPLNAAFLFDLADLGFTPGAQLVGIGWDVELSARSPSWLSELALFFSNSDIYNDPNAFYLPPGGGDDFAGVGDYSSGGIVSLADAGLDPIVFADGLLYLEFFEIYDDLPGVVDGIWLAGSTLTLQFEATIVPEPATITSMSLAAGLLGIAGLVRRRKAA